MAKETNKDTVFALLNKSDIAELYENILKRNEKLNPRFSLVMVVNELGGYDLNSCGGLSHLEWLGLGRMLSDYCEAQAEICFEESKKEGDNNASNNEENSE